MKRGKNFVLPRDSKLGGKKSLQEPLVVMRRAGFDFIIRGSFEVQLFHGINFQVSWYTKTWPHGRLHARGLNRVDVANCFLLLRTGQVVSGYSGPWAN